ncbi:MAG: hypothetical protein PHF23_08710 [Smithellaceae bacterium]|jgi:hypothetical protein|nr:hypothetical protein [Smithellaceae bacterium]
MKKLNTRQMIILAVATVAVLYAGYELLIAGPSAKKAARATAPVEEKAVLSALASDIMSNKATAADIYVAQRAEAPWSKNPFWDKASYRAFARKEEIKGAPEGPKVVYSGYVEAGTRKMAIINGWEYEAGQALDVEGYLLKKVTPSRVLIINRTTGGETYVPIQE